MSTTPSLNQGQEDISPEPPTIRRMRWFFLLLVTLWIFGAMALPVVAFYLTKDPLSFTFFTTLAPPVYIMYRVVAFLFPKDERDFQLALTKIQLTAKKAHDKGQVL